MAWYRELAEGRTFQCAECGRRKRVKYVPTSDLCRSCAAKKAGEKRRLSSLPIELKENLIVTKAVERRLRKKAQAEIPRTKADKLDELMGFAYLPFIASAYLVANSLFSTFSGWWYISLFVWGLLIPYIIDIVVARILAKPRKERMERIALRVAALAEERKRKIEEARQFYSSPEWALLRRQIIQEEGQICAECGKQIARDEDITIDHKYPRSKYPDLALSKHNLRVLCRNCNARKGAREWIEI